MKYYPRRPSVLKRMTLYTSVLLVALLATPQLAWSYVDPGIAGMVYQIGFLVVAALSAALALFGRKISAWTRKLVFWRPKEGSED